MLENKQSEVEFEVVLEALYNKNYGDENFKEKLKKSQEEWKKYITLHIESKFPEDASKYGSAITLCYHNLMTYYNSLRIKELRNMLVEKNEDKTKEKIAQLEEEHHQLIETLSDIGAGKEQ